MSRYTRDTNTQRHHGSRVGDEVQNLTSATLEETGTVSE